MSTEKDGDRSVSPELDRFASLLDGLLRVPRSELDEALEKENAAKKVKAASRAAVAHKR